MKVYTLDVIFAIGQLLKETPYESPMFNILYAIHKELCNIHERGRWEIEIDN